MRRYDNPAIALSCGAMLRDCMRDESLARCLPFADTLCFKHAFNNKPAMKRSSSALVQTWPCRPCSCCLLWSGLHAKAWLCAKRTPTRPTNIMHAACRLVLEGPLFGHYFDKVEVSNFEVASDAFSTFKVRYAASPAHIRGQWCSLTAASLRIAAQTKT